MPPTVAMRADLRFPPRMRLIGLVDDWRMSGDPPDDASWLGAPATGIGFMLDEGAPGGLGPPSITTDAPKTCFREAA